MVEACPCEYVLAVTSVGNRGCLPVRGRHKRTHADDQMHKLTDAQTPQTETDSVTPNINHSHMCDATNDHADALRLC